MLYKIAGPRYGEHHQLLDCLRTILQTNPTAKRDARELGKSIKKGCCATFSTITPHQIPATLKIR